MTLAVFPQRHPGYRIGAVWTLIGVVPFLLGFGSQYWSSTTKQAGDEIYEVYSGLWGICLRSPANRTRFVLGQCTAVSSMPEYVTAWFGAVQGLQCVALVGLIAATALVFGLHLVTQRRQALFFRNPVIARIIELIVILSTIIGGISLAVYGSMHPGYIRHPAELSQVGQLTIEFTLVNWSLGLSALGLGCAFCSGVLMALFNRNAPAPDVDGDDVKEAVLTSTESSASSLALRDRERPLLSTSQEGKITSVTCLY